MHMSTLLRRRPDLLRSARSEDGATTAEYATVTGAGVGFAALLWKFLTSDAGQAIIKAFFDWVLKILGI